MIWSDQRCAEVVSHCGKTSKIGEKPVKNPLLIVSPKRLCPRTTWFSSISISASVENVITFILPPKLKSHLIIVLKIFELLIFRIFLKILNVVLTNFLADFLWLSWTWFITVKHISWKIKIRTKPNISLSIQIKKWTDCNDVVNIDIENNAC